MAQKGLLSLIQTVSAELNLPQPTTVLSSTEKNVIKLLAFTRAVCDDLVAEYDWQQLQTRYTFTATGLASYQLPADYERMIDATAFNSSNRWPVQGPLTPVEWESVKANSNASSPYVHYRLYANALYVLPTTTTATFNLEYISNYVVRDSSTQAIKADFGQDSDICLFDHRPMVYGIKLKWKESIGADTSTALSEYMRALEAAKGTDVPGRRLSLIGGTNGFVPISTANIPDWI